jgi:radical SAM superfamily enzyme YgiQ (UPF0313 family)
MQQQKKKGYLVGMYIPGVYPPGRDDVQVHLLAPAFLKSCADADLQICKEYDLEIINVSIKTDLVELAERMSKDKPHFIGYSVYCWNYLEIAENVRLLKNLSPETRILMGGPQVSFLRQETMEENPLVDVIIAGTGEGRFLELLRIGFDSAELAEMPNISYRNGNGIVLTEGQVQEDVSIITSPFASGAIDLNDGNDHTVMIETFRGCPMRCAYCQWGSPDGATYRYSLDQVLADIESIYSNESVQYVYLVDANLFYTPKDHWKPILDKILEVSKRTGREIPTVASLDMRVLNEDMVRSLSKISLALNQYQFGMQSMTPGALDLANRQCKDGTWENGMKMIREVDPESQISLEVIYGLPGDTFEGFLETVDFALGLRPNKFYMFPLLVLPGTPFWDQRGDFEFRITEAPEYMVVSNKDYSEEDMRKTFRFATWFQAMQRFPAIQNALLASANNGTSRVDVIQDYMSQLRDGMGYDPTEGFDFSLRSANVILREIMDAVHLPQNCLIAYEVTKEIANSHNGIAADLDLGLDYYNSRIGSPAKDVDADFEKQHGSKKLRDVKCNWFVSDNNIG